MYTEQELDWAVNKASKDIAYLIRVGLIKLQEVPELLRTRDVCMEACRMDPAQAAFIPDLVMEEMPTDIQEEAEKHKEFASAKEKEEQAKCDHHEDRKDEMYYRQVTGDYDHDYDVDADDKEREAFGDAFIDF